MPKMSPGPIIETGHTLFINYKKSAYNVCYNKIVS